MLQKKKKKHNKFCCCHHSVWKIDLASIIYFFARILVIISYANGRFELLIGSQIL